MQVDTTLLSAKYIYLDWNVFKYLIEPRIDKKDIDEAFRNTVLKLKKKYKFPFSIAHIKDRANNYSREHYEKVRADIWNVKCITDGICVAICDHKPVLVKEDMQKCFDDFITDSKKEVLCDFGEFPFSFDIDMSKVSIDHPMHEFLEKQQGKITGASFNDFLQTMYDSIFRDIIQYKKLRDYIQAFDPKDALNQKRNFDELTYLDKLLWHMFPFLDSFNDDIPTLARKWKRIAERWFSLNNEELNSDLLLVQGYMLLDMHPIFKEKLKKKKNTLDNIIRDGNHCFYGSQAQYFVSEDEYTRQKTAFIYKAYNIKTKVVDEKSFLGFFEITS